MLFRRSGVRAPVRPSHWVSSGGPCWACAKPGAQARPPATARAAACRALRMSFPPPPLARGWRSERKRERPGSRDRKSTRLNSSHVEISYAVFCLKKKKITKQQNDVDKVKEDFDDI